MNPEEQRIAIAEACGWVWYRIPSLGRLDHSKPHRALFLPVVHEFHQSPEWMVRADGTERNCNWKYMEENGHVPDYLNDLNAAVGLCDFLAEKGWRCEIGNGLDKTWECTFWRAESPYTISENVGERDGSKTEEHYGCADRLAQAISDAFLRTIGKWRTE